MLAMASKLEPNKKKNSSALTVLKRNGRDDSEALIINDDRNKISIKQNDINAIRSERIKLESGKGGKNQNSEAS